MRAMRRDEILEVVEVEPLTVAEVEPDDDEPVLTEPAPRAQPVRA